MAGEAALVAHEVLLYKLWRMISVRMWWLIIQMLEDDECMGE